MSLMSQLALVREMLESCESSLRSAKQLLNEMTGGQASRINYSKIAEKLPDLNEDMPLDAKSKVVEGVFDGQTMVGRDKNVYPVPANYASKSKLIPGDVLKLTISPEGQFLYKQIGPTDRKTILGTLTLDGGKYRVLAGGKVYNVLLASVTYFKGEPGDQVSLVVPENSDTEWGAIEAVIPQLQLPRSATSFMDDKEESFHTLNDEEKTIDDTPLPKAKKPRKSKKASDDGIEDLDI